MNVLEQVELLDAVKPRRAPRIDRLDFSKLHHHAIPGRVHLRILHHDVSVERRGDLLRRVFVFHRGEWSDIQVIRQVAGRPLVIAHPGVRLETRMLDLERLGRRTHVERQRLIQVKNRHVGRDDLGAFAVARFGKKEKRSQAHPLAVVTHAVFFFDPLALLGIDPVPALGVVVAVRQILAGSPVPGPAGLGGVMDRFLQRFRVVNRERQGVGVLDRSQLLDHDREGVDIPEITPHQEGQGHQGFEELFEHDNDSVALGNL
jgi:hypothetical protein